MVRRFLVFLFPAALLAVSACQKLENVRPFASERQGTLPIETAKFLDAIPSDYGDLVGVTSSADAPAWAQAWFQQPDKSIVVLWINARTGQVHDRVLVIPRR